MLWSKMRERIIHLLQRLLQVKHHKTYLCVTAVRYPFPTMSHSGQPKLLAPNEVLSQLEELELSQAQHEVSRDRKYDRKHCLIQQHIKYLELQGCCEEHTPSRKSPLPLLKETHLLILPIYFFPVLIFVRKRHPNQLSRPLKDLLSTLLIVRRNKVYSFKTEKKGIPYSQIQFSLP